MFFVVIILSNTVAGSMYVEATIINNILIIVLE